MPAIYTGFMTGILALSFLYYTISFLYYVPCYLYAEHIMRHAGLDEAQAGITIARRNINNLRYADATTLMAESEKELKSLLMKVRRE